MRILVVGRHHGAEIRGATVATHGLVQALVGRGHSVALLQSARPEHRVDLPGVEMHYLGVTRKSLYPLLFALRRPGRFDLVHAGDESAAYFALRARLFGSAVVAQLNPAVVHAEGFWRSGWRWRYIGLAARYAPIVVTPSRWLADQLATRYRRERARFVAIPYGIGEHWFGERECGPRDGGRPARVVLVNLKGVEVALRAFAKAAAECDARLELYGCSEREEQYRALALELGIAPLVHFAGFVPNAQLPARLAGADVLLHPTPAESFGQVLAEAAALGIPALSSRVGAVPEVVDPAVSGLLCAPGDVDAFAQGLVRVLGDRVLQRRLGDAARRRAAENWRWDAIVRRLEHEVYAPLLLRRKAEPTLPWSRV